MVHGLCRSCDEYFTGYTCKLCGCSVEPMPCLKTPEEVEALREKWKQEDKNEADSCDS
jgi:hypothetical protein